MIVEDQMLVADVLEAFLSRQPGIEVIANLRSAAECAPLMAQLNPHIVILSFRANDEVSAAAVKAICEADSETKIVFLTSDERNNVTLAAIDAGASAVLYLSMAAAELIQAVRFVAGGGSLISPQTIAALLTGRRTSDAVHISVTTREREILRLMNEGTSNRGIASILGISYTTVRSHVRNVATKLAAHSNLEVLVRAQQLGLVGALSPATTAHRDGFTDVRGISN